jgi:hypothetical protein
MDLAPKAKSLTCYSMPLGGCHVRRFKALSAHGRDAGVFDRVHHTSFRGLPRRKGPRGFAHPRPRSSIPTKKRDGSRDLVGYDAGKKVKDIKRNAVADMLHFAFPRAEAATLSLKQHGHAGR